MADVMLALGPDYRFSVDTATYDGLRRRSEYRWAQLDRIAHRPSLQYVGMGMEEIDLRGVIYPHYKGGLRQLDHMRIAAGKGKPLDLVTGRGENLGKYCITEIEEEQSVFAAKGAPRCMEFRMRLQHYGPDEEETGASGVLSFQAPKTTLGAVLQPPAALVSNADLSRVPQITTAELAPYTAGLQQSGITKQQAAKTLSTAVERLRTMQRTSSAAYQVLTRIKWDYTDLQSGISHDPLGTIGRVLSSVSILGTGARVAMASLFGADIASQMTQLGSAFSLSKQISSTISAVAR